MNKESQLKTVYKFLQKTKGSDWTKKNLQPLFKGLPRGGMYESRFESPPGTTMYETEWLEVPYWFPEGQDEESWNKLTPEEQEAFLEEDVKDRFDDDERIEGKDWKDMTPEEQQAYGESDEADEDMKRLIQAEEVTIESIAEVDYAQISKDEAVLHKQNEIDFDKQEEKFIDSLPEPEGSIKDVPLAKRLSNSEIGRVIWNNISASKDWEDLTPEEQQRWEDMTQEERIDEMNANRETADLKKSKIVKALHGSRFPGNDGIELPEHHLRLLNRIAAEEHKVVQLNNVAQLFSAARKYANAGGKGRISKILARLGLGKKRETQGVKNYKVTVSDKELLAEIERLETIGSILDPSKDRPTWEKYEGYNPENDSLVIPVTDENRAMVSSLLALHPGNSGQVNGIQSQGKIKFFGMDAHSDLSRETAHTVVHEVAHQIQESLPDEFQLEISMEYNKALETNRGFISNYSKGSNDHEFFAECYSAYFTDTEFFRKRNPSMAKLLERIFSEEEPVKITQAHFDEMNAEDFVFSEWGSGLTSLQKNALIRYSDKNLRQRAVEISVGKSAIESYSDWVINTKQSLQNEEREFRNKGLHQTKLEQERLIANMLMKAAKEQTKTSNDIHAESSKDLGIWSPNAADGVLSTKSTLDTLLDLKIKKASVPFLKAKGKYKGRTGGITPDWTMKLPGEERDIDEWAEARRKKAENRQWGIVDMGGQQPMSKTWVGSLNEKGFSSPVIKQVLGSQMWFIQDGVDYVATLGTSVVMNVEKAKFPPIKSQNMSGIATAPSYSPAGRNTNKRTIINEDEEDSY